MNMPPPPNWMWHMNGVTGMLLVLQWQASGTGIMGILMVAVSALAIEFQKRVR